MTPETGTPGPSVGDERGPRFGVAAEYDPPPEYLRRGPPSLDMAEGSGRGLWRRVLPALVALVTLGAFAGGVWFAYEQGVRQGLRLSPPLVRADPGPVKIEPADPGGLQIPNQDRQVFEALDGGAQPPSVEQLLPPPEEPIEVVPEPEPEPEIVTAELPPVAELAPTEEAAPPAAAPPVPTPADLAAVTPLSRQPPLPGETAPAPAPAATGDAAESAAGPTQLLPESERTAAPAASAATAAVPASAGPPALAAPEPSPGFRVQIGSYAARERALAGWTVLKARYPQILDGLQAQIVEADVGGRTFHRLQAGSFPTAGAAGAACGRLREAGGDCLVVNP